MKIISKIKLIWYLKTMPPFDKTAIREILEPLAATHELTFGKNTLRFSFRPVFSEQDKRLSKHKRDKMRVIRYSDIISCEKKEYYVKIITRKYSAHFLSLTDRTRVVIPFMRGVDIRGRIKETWDKITEKNKDDVSTRGKM